MPLSPASHWVEGNQCRAKACRLTTFTPAHRRQAAARAAKADFKAKNGAHYYCVYHISPSPVYACMTILESTPPFYILLPLTAQQPPPPHTLPQAAKPTPPPSSRPTSTRPWAAPTGWRRAGGPSRRATRRGSRSCGRSGSATISTRVGVGVWSRGVDGKGRGVFFLKKRGGGGSFVGLTPFNQTPPQKQTSAHNPHNPAVELINAMRAIAEQMNHHPVRALYIYAYPERDAAPDTRLWFAPPQST